MADDAIAMKWFLCGLFIFFIGSAVAKDDGRYGDSPNRAWFRGLLNNDGQSCCDIADGQRIDDTDWRTTADGHYQVKVNDAWITVPDYAVLNPRNRPVDYAVLWIYHGKITCFLVGSGT